MSKSLMIIALAAMSFSSEAIIRKEVVSGESVSVTLSTKDPNVISVKGDRIERFTATKGVLSSSLDNKRGVLTLKPSNSALSEPFSMILFTEKGSRYTLIVAPAAIPSQDIILSPESVGQETASAFEKKSPYTEMVVGLIRSMVNDELPEDFKRTFVEEKSKSHKNGLLKITSIYQGSSVSGQTLEYVHAKNGFSRLFPSDFHSPDVIAVALNKEFASVGEKITVFRVVKNG